MRGPQCFKHKSDVIADKQKWAEGRGERIVKYRAERVVAIGDDLVLDEYEGEMPESFWRHYKVDGWTFTEIAPPRPERMEAPEAPVTSPEPESSPMPVGLMSRVWNTMRGR